MLIYVVTRDGVVMHIATDFDEAVLDMDEGIKLTLREIREKLGQH